MRQPVPAIGALWLLFGLWPAQVAAQVADAAPAALFSPEVFSPEVFSPEVFSPEVFSPEVFSPEVFSPEVALPSPMPHESQSPFPEEIPVLVPRPFEQGTMNLGLIFGLSAGSETTVTLGGHFGYYVLPGLEPGIEVDAIFGSSRATTLSVMPYLRWVFWRSYALSPYLKAQGGRWFIFSGYDDLTALGGGGGLVIFLNRTVGLQVEGLVFGLLPREVCDGDCVATSIGLSLGFYLGRR